MSNKERATRIIVALLVLESILFGWILAHYFDPLVSGAVLWS